MAAGLEDSGEGEAVKRSTLIIVVVAILVLGGGAVVITSRNAFLKLIADEVRRQLPSSLSETKRVLAAKIVAAQAALESGYGRTKAFREGWNFGNVSAGSSWKGPVIGGGDLEYDSAGNMKKIAQKWRKYDSLASAVYDFMGLLSWSRYAAARDALYQGDALAYVEKLRAGGYFTAPAKDYVAGITSALKGFA